MNVSLLLQFWTIAVVLALTPGADWAYAISAGFGARSVVPSVLGLVCGYIGVVAVVVLGVGVTVSRYPTAVTVLTIAGGGYLLYLGATTLSQRVEAVATGVQSLGDRPAAQFFAGVGVSGINPKGLLLLLALLPQFIAPTGWPSPLQMLVLGGLHVVNCAVIYFAVATLARRVVQSRPGAAAVVTKIAGAVMLTLGAAILIEKAAQLW